MPSSASASGTTSFAGTAEGATRGSPKVFSRVVFLPAWWIWIDAMLPGAWMISAIRASPSTCRSSKMPSCCRARRPSGETTVASTITRPGPAESR